MKYMNTLLILFFLFILNSCAGNKKKSLFPEYDISEIYSRSIAADSLSKTTAAQLDIVNNALLTTREEISDLREMQDDVSPSRIEELEIHLALLTEAFKDLYATVHAIQVMPQVNYVPVKPKRPRGITLSSAGAVFSNDEYDLYKRAQDVYRNGFYLESRQLLNALVEKYPTGDYLDRALFWIGETHFAEKSYDQAIVSFEKVLSLSASSKADDALYKQGLCYYKLGENDMALQLFSTLIQRYPASEYVLRSKKRIEQLSMGK